MVSGNVLDRYCSLRWHTCAGHSVCHLLQMVAGMSAVEETPFLSIQWSEEGMIEEFGTLPETSLGVEQSRIHRYQSIVKASHRLRIQPVLRPDLLEGGATRWHPTELRHHEFSYGVWQCCRASQRMSAFQNTA